MTIELLGLHRNDWERVAADPEAFAYAHQLALGVENSFLRGVAEQTLALFQRTGVTAQPWSGFLSVDRASNTIVGTCCFVAPPDGEGVVEIDFAGSGASFIRRTDPYGGGSATRSLTRSKHSLVESPIRIVTDGRDTSW